MVSRSGDHPNWQDHLEQSAAGCQLLTFVSKARDWWSETTDVVFLNSPWLRRSTGRGFRCLWISFHVLLWCLDVTNFGNFHQMKIPVGFQVVEWASFVFMFLAFAKVFFSSLTTSRETLSNSFLLGLASMLSFAFWDYFGGTPPELFLPGQNTFMAGFLAYTFPILCHCNFHPIVLILIFFCTIGFSLKHFQELETFGDAFFVLHIISFQFCMLFAFTLDFTNRVRAVATGILHNADGCNPLDSPVAGRSARGFCWLACILNWIFVAMFCWISSGLGVYPSSIYFLLDALCLCLPWMVLLCLCRPEGTPFKSDLVFVCLSYTPPFWVLIRPILAEKLAAESIQTAFDARIFWFLGGLSFACTSTVFATQSAIQAGCLPILCLLGVLFVMTTCIATISIYCDFCLEIVNGSGYEIPVLLALVT